MKAEDLQAGLSQHYGTENWYKHFPFNRLIYTDGVKFFAENAGGGAYWFLDSIGANVQPLQAKHPFLSIELRVLGSKAEIYVSDGNGNEIYLEPISYTDCPEGDWKFYLTDNILLLTSEY